MKRLVVGVFVSSLALFGVVPAASAATSTGTVTAKVYKAKKPGKAIDWEVSKPGKAIDWEAPKPVSGGMSTQRIDWE